MNTVNGKRQQDVLFPFSIHSSQIVAYFLYTQKVVLKEMGNYVVVNANARSYRCKTECAKSKSEREIKRFFAFYPSLCLNSSFIYLFREHRHMFNICFLSFSQFGFVFRFRSKLFFISVYHALQLSCTSLFSLYQ